MDIYQSFSLKSGVWNFVILFLRLVHISIYRVPVSQTLNVAYCQMMPVWRL